MLNRYYKKRRWKQEEDSTTCNCLNLVNELRNIDYAVLVHKLILLVCQWTYDMGSKFLTWRWTTTSSLILRGDLFVYIITYIYEYI